MVEKCGIGRVVLSFILLSAGTVALLLLFYFLTLSPLSILSAQSIEEEAISIIDQSFKTLRSSTAAFDLLLKFKHIRSTEAINNHLMRKFNDILIQFCKEVPCCKQENKNRNSLLTCSYQLLTVIVYISIWLLTYLALNILVLLVCFNVPSS